MTNASAAKDRKSSASTNANAIDSHVSREAPWGGPFLMAAALPMGDLFADPAAGSVDVEFGVVFGMCARTTKEFVGTHAQYGLLDAQTVQTD